MTITLQPERERAIQEAIRAGTFRSISEFIGAAISTLPTLSEAEPPTASRKSRLWELREGLTPGDLSIKELIEEGRE